MQRPTLFLSLSLALLLTACPSQNITPNPPTPNVFADRDNVISVTDKDGNDRGTITIPKGAVTGNGTLMLEVEDDTKVPPPEGVKPVRLTTLSIMASGLDISSFGDSNFSSQTVSVKPVVHLWLRYIPGNLISLFPKAAYTIPPGTRLRMYQIKDNKWNPVEGEFVNTEKNGVDAPLTGLGGNDIYSLGLEIIPSTLTDVSIVGPSKIKYGSSVKYQAIAKDNLGKVIPNATFDWQSSKPDTISIDSSGEASVVDLNDDDVVLSATYKGVKGQSVVSGYGIQTLVGPTNYYSNYFEKNINVTEMVVKARSKDTNLPKSDTYAYFEGPKGWHNDIPLRFALSRDQSYQFATNFDDLLLGGNYTTRTKFEGEDFTQLQFLSGSQIKGLSIADTSGLTLKRTQVGNSFTLTLQGQWPAVAGANSYLVQLYDKEADKYLVNLYTTNTNTGSGPALTLSGLNYSTAFTHHFYIELFSTSLDITKNYPSFTKGIQSSIAYNSIVAK
jgi:hypothetical protein